MPAQPYGVPSHFAGEADDELQGNLKQGHGVGPSAIRSHSTFAGNPPPNICHQLGETSFLYEDPRSGAHPDQPMKGGGVGHFMAPSRLGAHQYSEESSRCAEEAVGSGASRKVTAAKSARRQGALTGCRSQQLLGEAETAQMQKKEQAMGESVLPGSVPRMSKRASQQRVLKGAVAKINRKLRKKSAQQKKCSTESSVKQAQNCQSRKSKSGARPLPGSRSKNNSNVNTFLHPASQAPHQNDLGPPGEDRYYQDDEEEGSTINLRGVLFNTKQHQRRSQRQAQQPVNPAGQLHGQSQERQPTICNIQNCYVQIQLNQFDGPRGDMVPNLFHPQQQHQQPPEYYPQMHGPHQNAGGQHSLLSQYPQQYNMQKVCMNQQNPFGGAGNYQSGHHLLYPMPVVNANQSAYKPNVADPVMPHDFMRYPPPCRNDGSQVMQAPGSADALSEEDELASQGRKVASSQQRSVPGLLRRPPCFDCGNHNQPCSQSHGDCVHALQNAKSDKNHGGPQQRAIDAENAAHAAAKQHYDHYHAAMNYLPNEEVQKDKSDSNKILSSIDNDQLVANNNSRLQSQSSLINKKDCESLTKRNERQLGNRSQTNNTAIGFSNLTIDKNCCKQQHEANKSNVNNANYLRKHMQHLSNLAEQHCADPDQEDSIKQLRSDYRYGQNRRDSERLERKHHYHHSQVSEAVHDPPLSMMFGVNDQLNRDQHQQGSSLHIERKLHSVKSHEDVDEHEHTDEESLGIDGHHNESHYPLMKNQFAGRPDKKGRPQRQVNQRFEVENQCEPSLFLREQQEEIQTSNDSHSSKQIKKFFDVVRNARPDDPQQAKARRQSGKGAARTKGPAASSSRAEEVVWPAGNQVPEHNLDQLADSDIDIVSRNLPKVHNINQGWKASQEGQPKDARGEQEYAPSDLRVADGGASYDQGQDRKCLQLHHQFKAPRQKLPRIENEKRLRMQLRTVPFQRKRDQKVKDKAKKGLRRQSSRVNSDVSGGSARDPNGSGARPPLFDQEYFPNQFFDAQGGFRPAYPMHPHVPAQCQQHYDRAVACDHQLPPGVGMGYQDNCDRQALAAGPDPAPPIHQSQVEYLLGEKPEQLYEVEGAQHQLENQYIQDGAVHPQQPLHEHQLMKQCAPDAAQNNLCQSQPRLEANVAENQRTIKSEESKLAAFSQPLEVASQKDRRSLQHKYCPKCKCGTVTSQPTVLPKDEQLEMEANRQDECRSQKKTLAAGKLSQRSLSKKSSSAKVQKKRKLGPPHKKSEENYMFPASKRKNNRTVSYFSWKEQILKQNKIVSLNHISDPHPGCSAEIDEQKYRFIYELRVMQEERKRFEKELDHYYAYQKKCIASSPPRLTVERGHQGHKGSGHADHHVEGKSPYSDMKVEQVDHHLMCVQWSLKKIGTLSLQERFQKIQSYRKRRDCRQWDKKVSYDCRKVVADNRIRVKGRFIKKEDQNKMKQILEEAGAEAQDSGSQGADRTVAQRKGFLLQASNSAKCRKQSIDMQHQGDNIQSPKESNKMSSQSINDPKDSNKGSPSKNFESPEDKPDHLLTHREHGIIKPCKKKWKKSQAAARPEQEARTPSPDKPQSPFNAQPGKRKTLKCERRQAKLHKQEAGAHARPPQQHVSSTASVSAKVQKRQKKESIIGSKVEGQPEDDGERKIPQI